MSIPGWPGGAPYQPPPPPKKSNTLRIVLIVVGAVLVVCCGGGIIGGVFLFRGVSKATAPARDTADQFVSDLQNGDTTGAYALLCDATRKTFPPEDFASGVTGGARIVSHQFAGVNVSSGTGGTRAIVTMKLTMQNGFVDQHAFPLLKEDGRWKVCGAPY
jgi:hypothetical protein